VKEITSTAKGTLMFTTVTKRHDEGLLHFVCMWTVGQIREFKF
jgi:hypothetical protein